MSNTTLELTDTSGNDIFTNKNSTNSLSDDSDDDSIESNFSSKLFLFIENYVKQLILVFQSIIPDLRSFEYWQILILILYATFNVVFSILVNISFLFLGKN